MGDCIHKVSALIDYELVMRPKGIVEGEVAMLVWSLSVIKSGHVAYHVHAELAVE